MREFTKKGEISLLRQMILDSLGNNSEGSSESERKRRQRFFAENEIIEKPGSHIRVIGFIPLS